LNREEQKQLAARLATMSREEVNKLYKQASGIRKKMPQPEQRKARLSLDDVVMRLLDDESPNAKKVLETRTGVVTWTGPQTCRVGHIEAQLAGKRPAVGDGVTIGLSEDGRTWTVNNIHDRRTKLSRPDVGNANLERVIVANVDIIGIVVSVIAPPLHPRLIDRYLIAIQKGGADPIICVNKLDLLAEGSDELDLLEPYASLEVPIFGCSTRTGQGMAEVKSHLEGKMAAFVGHSGVGKSSLVNALYPGMDLDTGGVSQGYGRGTHTTTSSNLFEFEGGTRLIDTPGVRSFGLWKMTPNDLKWFFPEFEGIDCKFRDCSHSHEPQCGVRDAVKSGEVHPARYDTYLRLLQGD